MLIRTFTAPTVAGALKQVKKEMGGQAMILKTRRCPGDEALRTGDRFEVIACVDNNIVREKGLHRRPETITPHENVSPKSRLGRADDGDNDLPGNDMASVKIHRLLNRILHRERSPEIYADLPPDARAVFLNLVDADVPFEIAGRLGREIAHGVMSGGDLETLSLDIVENEISSLTGNVRGLRGGMKLAFVGPGGAGKTSVMGKIAARIVTEFGQKIKLNTLDKMKITARRELSAYSDLLRVPLVDSENDSEIPDDDAIVMIDTPSIGKNRDSNAELSEKLAALAVDMTFMVFSAGMRSSDLIDLIPELENLRPDYLIATHLDQSPRWGGLPTMAEYLEKPLVFVTDAPAGVGRLKEPQPRLIAEHLLYGEVREND